MLILKKRNGKRGKKSLHVFWLIHFSCLSTKTVLNILHLQGRLLEEIQISRSPTQAPRPKHREASRSQELFPLSCWIYSSTRLFGSDSFFSVLHCQGRNWILNLFFIWSQGKPTQWKNHLILSFLQIHNNRFKGFHPSKRTQVEWKEKKMTARYCNTGELSGKFHFRATTGKHSSLGAKKSARQQSSPHFGWVHCFTCECNFRCVPCLESESKPLWMRTIIQSRQAETIPQGLYDVCRKAVQNIAGKWERKERKPAQSGLIRCWNLQS